MNTRSFVQKLQKTFNLVYKHHFTPPPAQPVTHTETFSELVNYTDYDWQKEAVGATRWRDFDLEENEIRIPFDTTDERQVDFIITLIHVASALFSQSGLSPFADCEISKILNGDYESDKFIWTQLLTYPIPSDARLKEKALKAPIDRSTKPKPKPLKPRETTLGVQRQIPPTSTSLDSLLAGAPESYDSVTETRRLNNLNQTINRVSASKLNPASGSIFPAKLVKTVTQQTLGSNVTVSYLVRPNTGYASLSLKTYTISSYMEKGVSGYDIAQILDLIVDKTDQVNTTNVTVDLPTLAPEDSSIEVITHSHDVYFDFNYAFYVILCCGSISGPFLQRLNGVVTRYIVTNYSTTYPDTDDGRKKALAEKAILTVDGKWFNCYNSMTLAVDKARILNPDSIKNFMMELRHYCGSVLSYREVTDDVHIGQIFIQLMGILYGGLDTKKIKCRWFEWPVVANVPVTTSYAKFKGQDSRLPPYQCRKFTPREVMTQFSHWNLWAWILDLHLDKSSASNTHLSILKIYVLNAFSHMVLNASLTNSANILGPFPSFSGYSGFTSTSIVRDHTSCQRLALFLLRMLCLTDYTISASSSDSS